MTDALGVFGWDAEWAVAFAPYEPGGVQPGRVTAQHRDRWVVHGADGPHPARLVGSEPTGPRPVTGDWVAWTPGPHPSDPWTIVAVLPRRSAVSRGAAGDKAVEHVLAANVDTLWIVQALDTPPNLRSLERYLAVAWESRATPEIVLTKSDLAADLEEAVAAVNGIAFGTRVWAVSVEDTDALEALRDGLAPGRTIALLGPSGAGKSTLINHLAGAEVAGTGAVREGDRKGRHTTTSRELFPIRHGALLLDTPGMRELKVLELDEGLGHTFPDIHELAQDCRFRDCSHVSEPGCAVLAAVERGALGGDRLESFRKLQAEAAYERRRADPTARAEHVAEYKTAMRTMKYHAKYRQDDG